MPRYKQIKDLRELKEGDTVRGKTHKIAYVVVANYGTRVTAIRVADLTNAEEWEVFTMEKE